MRLQRTPRARPRTANTVVADAAPAGDLPPDPNTRAERPRDCPRPFLRVRIFGDVDRSTFSLQKAPDDAGILGSRPQVRPPDPCLHHHAESGRRGVPQEPARTPARPHRVSEL